MLTPNASNVTLMILNLKPKVTNVIAKTWFIKINLQQEMFNF